MSRRARLEKYYGNPAGTIPGFNLPATFKASYPTRRRNKNKAFLVYLGRIIRKHRKTAGLTIYDAAARLGTTYQCVSNWERGYATPLIVNLVEHCISLGVKASDVIAEAESLYELDRLMRTDAEAMRRLAAQEAE